jgi:hypothetical protein
MVVLQIRRVPVNKIKHPWINRRTAGKVNPEFFFSAHPLKYQKGIGKGDQGNLVMPSLPGAAFEMIQTNRSLHLFIVLLNPEASFRLSYQPPERSSMGRQTESLKGI